MSASRNDFIIVGPSADPAHIKGMTSAMGPSEEDAFSACVSDRTAGPLPAFVSS